MHDEMTGGSVAPEASRRCLHYSPQPLDPLSLTFQILGLGSLGGFALTNKGLGITVWFDEQG